MKDKIFEKENRKMLEFGDIITLENNKKYLVSGTCTYNNKYYVYLVNIENQLNCVLGSVREDDFQEITDEEEFKQVMPMILDNVDMSLFEDGGKDE